MKAGELRLYLAEPADGHLEKILKPIRLRKGKTAEVDDFRDFCIGKGVVSIRDLLAGLGFRKIEIVTDGYIVHEEALNPVVVNTIKKVWKTEIGTTDLNTAQR